MPALLRLLARRLLLALPLLLAVTVVTFVIIHLAPGDPALIFAGEAPTPELLQAVRAEYDLDRPIYEQLTAFLGKAATGDFGRSIYYGRPVFDVILERLPATLLLTGTSLAIASLVGVALGVAAARRAGSVTDTLISSVALAGYSVPGFWTAQLLVLLFAVQLNWLPVGGMLSVGVCNTASGLWIDLARHMVLPVVTLVIFLMTLTARFTRAAMVEVLDQDFVTVAAAKGASPRRLVWHHAFRNALVTVVTVIGLEFGAVLAGSLVIEIVYSWPGLGRLFHDAIFRRDFPLLTGLLIFTSAMVVASNVLTDAVCMLIDPRLRSKHERQP